MASKHYNCAWCGRSLGHHANEWDAIAGLNYCPHCGKPSWSSHDNCIIPQVFAAAPALHRMKQAHVAPRWTA